MDLDEKKKTLDTQLKECHDTRMNATRTVEVMTMNIHRIEGSLAILNELIAEQDGCDGTQS